jgi:hypothetical protein
MEFLHYREGRYGYGAAFLRNAGGLAAGSLDADAWRRSRRCQLLR